MKRRFALAALMLLPVASLAQEPIASCLVDAARQQVGVTVHYDPAYRQLAYPNGDLPPDRGVCTDVVIRAYRRLGVDLQQQVHEDMLKHWSSYPKTWGLQHPDPSIDHRRVPNLAVFFHRHGQSLPIGADPADYVEGDLVTWDLGGGVPHIGIVSAKRTAGGVPLMIHNIGAGAAEEDMLFSYKVTGHFRYFPPGSTCSAE